MPSTGAVPMVNDLERMYILWLALSGSLTWQARQRLMEAEGGAAAAYTVQDLTALGIPAKAAQELAALRRDGLDRLHARLYELGIAHAQQGEEGYPGKLAHIIDPPHVLFYKGTLATAQERAVAVVGSRRETRYGREQAFRIARELAQSGVTVVSGLARGVDTAAHKGALEGGGRTIAVLGSGLNNLYPPENKELAQEIVARGGAVVSELPPTSEPMAFHFPVRNRIISGLSDAVLLVEAREKSGTWITVGHALAQGREVFALPGPVDAPGSALPHKLIREGARLCTCAKDIMEDMGWLNASQHIGEQLSFDTSGLTDGQRAIYDALCAESQSFDELLAVTKLPVSDLNTQLTLLELDGLVETLPGRLFRLIRT